MTAGPAALAAPAATAAASRKAASERTIAVMVARCETSTLWPWRRRPARPSSWRSATPATSATRVSRRFANPGVAAVELRSDELTAVCPITGQPDLYRLTIGYRPDALCLESKSLKLYLNAFRNEGVFCEALAVRIRDDVAAALGLDADRVSVELEQKARGGITITARV